MFKKEHKFRIGDKVRCIDPGNTNHLEMGKRYVVMDLSIYDELIYVNKEILPEHGVFGRRFELVKEEYAENMTYKHLYNAAKEAKIANRSKMNKAQIIAALNNVQPHVAVKPAPVPLGVQLREKVKANPPREICSFAYQYVGRPKPEFVLEGYCHAKLQYEKLGITTLVADVARHVEKHKFPEAYKEYLDYLINRSPHAPNFITKNVDEAFESSLYLNTEGLHSRVVASIIAAREGSEFPHRVHHFKKFKNAGISENVSWFLANFLHSHGTEYSINQQSDGHSVLNYDMDYSDICKFFKEGFHTKLTDEPMKVKTGAYTIFKSIARMHRERGPNLYDTMLETMKEVRNGGFGAKIKTYTIDALKPLIEKLEKDFA